MVLYLFDLLSAKFDTQVVPFCFAVFISHIYRHAWLSKQLIGSGDVEPRFDGVSSGSVPVRYSIHFGFNSGIT